jgi:glyoxylase-like metal-dependent hydrolase (beta-lactamase superfamily II)
MNFLNICHIRYRPIWAENFEKVYESWNKLLKHGAKIIYPAHGKPFGADKLIFPMRYEEFKNLEKII